MRSINILYNRLLLDSVILRNEPTYPFFDSE